MTLILLSVLLPASEADDFLYLCKSKRRTRSLARFLRFLTFCLVLDSVLTMIIEMLLLGNDDICYQINFNLYRRLQPYPVCLILGEGGEVRTRNFWKQAINSPFFLIFYFFQRYHNYHSNFQKLYFHTKMFFLKQTVVNKKSTQVGF